MDFNMKKLASDAGIFFTRAVQVRLCALGPARPAPGARMWDGPEHSCSRVQGAQQNPFQAVAPFPASWRTPLHPLLLCCPGERDLGGRPSRTLGVARGWGPSRASALLPARELLVSTILTRRVTPLLWRPPRDPVGTLLRRGEGTKRCLPPCPCPAVTGSQQAFGGASPRRGDSCLHHDLFSEPQSPHLCGGLVVP